MAKQNKRTVKSQKHPLKHKHATKHKYNVIIMHWRIYASIQLDFHWVIFQQSNPHLFLIDWPSSASETLRQRYINTIKTELTKDLNRYR